MQSKQRKKKISCKTLLVLLPLFVFLAACSTQPKQTGDIYDLRKNAETQFDLGNKQADRGNYESAFILLKEAQRLAIITDEPSLRIRTALSLGNVLFTLGNSPEASMEWEAALDEAQKEGNRELTAVSRIHLARYRLLSNLSPAGTVREEVNRELANIKSDELYIAFGWMVIGLAEGSSGRYAEAEAAFKRSLNIHEKRRYLEQAAYDWYLIASFRSQAGNPEGALEALTNAIKLDRRVENSYGLATDWRAIGDVYNKAGKVEESRVAYLRSARIFRMMGDDEAAQTAETRIRQ